MDSPVCELEEDETRERAKTRMQEFVGDISSEFFVYVLECNPEPRLRRNLFEMDGEAIVDAVQEGEDAWLDLPAKVRPPMGDHQSNFPKWVEQAVEAEEVYYVGQTRSPVDRIAEHAIAGPESANMTRLFAPQKIIHIEPVETYEGANDLEDLISEFITYGCEIESKNYTEYGEVPDQIPNRLEEFANPEGPDIEIENGRNIGTFQAAPNNFWTAHTIFYLSELPSRIVGWDAMEEMDAYPIEKSIVVDSLLTSLERVARIETSFDYEREILLEQIEALESWFESSEEYPERGDPEDQYWDVDEGIESTAEGKEYFQELHELAKERIIDTFLSDFRERTRELHPSPLRFAYSDKTPNLELESIEGDIQIEPEKDESTTEDSTQASIDDLTEKERSRLLDIVDLAPTSNGELQKRWALEESSDVHYYLEDHLSQWYYRDSNNLIRVIDSAKDEL